MCLAIPGRVVRILAADPALPVAEVDYGHVRKTAQLLYLPDVRVGDFVIVQAGFAVRRMGEAEAREALEYAARPLPPEPGARSVPTGAVGSKSV